MSKKVLITGGAGFIGSHVADRLIAEGYHVRALDNLCEQVHGPGRKRPDYLNNEVELVVGDIRDPDAVREALDGVSGVYHFAAMVGVGQSMYEISNYVSVNNYGTAVLLEAIATRPVERLIVASSMSIYGEGLYSHPDGSTCNGVERSLAQLKAGDWELRDASGDFLAPLPTPESKTPTLASIYALSKYDQERMCLIVGRSYGIPTVAFRLFNVFGPRQALSNPYTGVLAIFASRYMNDNPPLIYEDGEQQRDFVSVHDVARACVSALEVPDAGGYVLNIGSGKRYTIRQIAEQLSAVIGADDIKPVITGKYRAGDIRHCFADITLAREILHYQPQVSLLDGILELAQWLQGQAAIDYVPRATSELMTRGLTL